MNKSKLIIIFSFVFMVNYSWGEGSTLKQIVKMTEKTTSEFLKEYTKKENFAKTFDIEKEYKQKYSHLDSLITKKVFKLLSKPGSIEKARTETKDLIQWREMPSNPSEFKIYKFASFDNKKPLYVNYRFFKVNKVFSFYICENSIYCPLKHYYRITPRKYIILFQNGKASLHFIGKPFQLSNIGFQIPLGLLGIIKLSNKMVYSVFIYGPHGSGQYCKILAFPITKSKSIFPLICIWEDSGGDAYAYSENNFEFEWDEKIYNLKEELTTELQSSGVVQRVTAPHER